MNKTIYDQIEEQAEELYAQMKVPRCVRLGRSTYKELVEDLDKSSFIKDETVDTVDAFELTPLPHILTTRNIFLSVGKIEIVKDTSLPPDAVVVEE